MPGFPGSKIRWAFGIRCCNISFSCAQRGECYTGFIDATYFSRREAHPRRQSDVTINQSVNRHSILMLIFCVCFAANISAPEPNRLRVIIETDAGGDPDDEQSLVRFLLYVNEWDVEGIIANRPVARDGENRNPERTGLGIVRAMVRAYGQCYSNLVQHDSRYPKPEQLLERTVAGYDDTEDGVKLVIAAVDRDDPRPIWFCNWGTDHGAA